MAFLKLFHVLKKQLKYFISILLISSLVVNEYTSNSQDVACRYFQTSQVVKNKRIADLKIYYFAKGHFSKKILLIFTTCFQTLLYHFKKQVETTLELQESVVLRINNLIFDYLFYYKSRLHSTKIYSSLYSVA